MGLQLDVLKATFQRAQQENGGARALGLRFYERLFEQYPGVKPLFKTPPEEQHKKLLASIGAILSSATNPEQMVPFLQAMAIRHVSYGTDNAHYPAVKENLVAVLGEHLSKEGQWTEAMAQAWNEALDAVNSVMTEAASNPKACEDNLKKAGYLPNGFRVKQEETPWELAHTAG